MISRGFFLTRVLGIPLVLIFSFLSLLQIKLCLQSKKKKSDFKYCIHICCFAMTLGIFIIFIDPDGVYGVIPYVVDKFVVHTSGIFMQAGFCFVVYSHFWAHYLSLREPMPNYFGKVFTWITVIGMVITYVGNALAFITNRRIFFMLDTLKSISYALIVLATDLFGYCLVRSLIRGQMDRNKFGEVHLRGQKKKEPLKKQQKNHQHKHKTHVSMDYEDILSRLFKFHALLVLACSLFVFTNLLLVLSLLQNGPAAPVAIPKDNPGTLTLNTTAFCYLFLFVWMIYTWWSWLPLKPNPDDPQSDTPNSSQETTNLASSKSDRKMELSDHHCQSIKEEAGSTTEGLLPSATTTELQIWNPHLIRTVDEKERSSSVDVSMRQNEEGIELTDVVYLVSNSEPGSPLCSPNSSEAATPLESSVPTTPSLIPSSTASVSSPSMIHLSPADSPPTPTPEGGEKYNLERLREEPDSPPS